MSKDEFILHEWEKEKTDYLVKSEIFEDGVKNGTELGKKQTTIEMIKAMIKSNIDLSTISKISNKSIDEIKEIGNIG